MVGGIDMESEQFENVKREIEDINSVINFWEKINLYIEKEMQADNTSNTLMNDIMEIIKASVMKFIESKLANVK